MANPGLRLEASGRGEAPTQSSGEEQQKPKAGDRELKKALSRAERRWTIWLIIPLVLVVVAGGIAFLVFRNKPPPAAQYITTEIKRGDVFETIQSTGQVKPVTEVQIGAQVSGRIVKVHVDFNSEVKAGDLLAEIDPELIGTQIDANSAQVAAAAASVKRAEANMDTAKVRLDRARKVYQEGVGSQADLDTAQGAYDVTIADVTAAKAQVAQLNASLRRERTNLTFTKIHSPIAGVVINRAVDPGQTISAGFQTPTLFVIAQDLRKMRVLADIDEADVGRLKEKMTADIRVDAFPGEAFKGVVSQVRYSPVNQSGVVTYAAVIEVDNPEIKLRPGMTATATIHSAESKGTWRLPNAALRFKPSPPMGKDGKPLPQDPLPALPAGKGRIYVLTDAKPGAEKIEMREVEIGITDGVHTALRSEIGDLKVVTDETDEASKQARGRRMF